MKNIQHLCDLLPGQTAFVQKLMTCGNMRRRLLDIGLAEGTPVECVGVSPFGDPHAYLIRGAVIAIRRKDAATVLITPDGGGYCDGTD